MSLTNLFKLAVVETAINVDRAACIKTGVDNQPAFNVYAQPNAKAKRDQETKNYPAAFHSGR